ncbi:MAG: fatty acid kinase fatty acid binding subunit [Chloroflexia bacterium]|nr:fatty acid kinase fatty acid binding subunit [Chloroflexia bacterium]
MPNQARQVKIVTDSAADIPPQLARGLDITVIPLLVHMGGHTYQDGVDLSGEEFYRELQDVKGVTTTSLPPLHPFEEAYRSLTRDGYEVVSIHLSSKLSGTFNAALMASTGDGVEAEAVSVVDSRTISMSQGWVAIRCAEAARAGKSREEIEELAESLLPKSHIFGALDTLEYVIRSGRVGRIPGTVGNMLSIKPLVTIQPTGEAIITERVRTEKRALERIVELAGEQGELDAFAVLHGANEEGAAQLLQMVRERLNPPEPVVMGHIGAVLGTHLGPGAVGVCFLTK